MNNQTKKVAFLGLATAFALILSYVEMLLPPIWAAVPGIKIGLPNIVIIFLLYRFSAKYAVAVSIARVLISSLLFSNVMVMVYSLAGAALSLTVMALLKKSNLFSPVGVSIAGGVSHNLGQILTAMLLLQTKEIGYYMIVLCVTGVVAGIFVGFVGTLLLKYSKSIKF